MRTPRIFLIRRFKGLREALRGDALKGALLRGALGSAALKAVNVLLGMAVAVVLARFLGATGYGIYAFALSVVSLLAIPAQVGLQPLLVREISKYRLKREWGLLLGVLRRANQIALALSFGIALVVWAVAQFLFSDPDPVKLETFLWAVLLIPLMALGNIRGAALRGLSLVVQGQLPEMLLRPGLLLLLAGSAALLTGLTPPVAMMLYVIAAAMAFLAGAILLRRATLAEINEAKPEYETRAWLRSLLPFSLLSGIAVINSQTDIVMLGLFATSAEVGVYRAVTQGAGLVVFLLSAVNMVIAPHVSQLHAAGDMERLQRLATTSARAVLLAAIPVAGVFILYGDTILTAVLGEEFESGHAPLAVLCVGHLFNAAAGSVGLLLNMGGFERDTVRGIAVATASKLLLNLVLIPIWGMTGAAISTVVSLVIWNTLLWRQVWIRMGIQSAAFRFRLAK